MKKYLIILNYVHNHPPNFLKHILNFRLVWSFLLKVGGIIHEFV
jgi:hypothetical protein